MRYMWWLAAILVGVGIGLTVEPATADSADSGWKFIDSTPYSCGYYRNHVDNTNYWARARTMNVTYYTGNPCATSNGLTALGPYYLSASATLVDDDGNWVCGSTGTVYNTNNASDIIVTANYVAQGGCQKHASDPFFASGSGSRWNGNLGAYVSSGAVHSPSLLFN